MRKFRIKLHAKRRFSAVNGRKIASPHEWTFVSSFSLEWPPHRLRNGGEMRNLGMQWQGLANRHRQGQGRMQIAPHVRKLWYAYLESHLRFIRGVTSVLLIVVSVVLWVVFLGFFMVRSFRSSVTSMDDGCFDWIVCVDLCYALSSKYACVNNSLINMCGICN